ncbi:MAG: hypothetical protein K0U93_10310 [Gammaproteobacteria bacterium]|nr:hypothetical protein [Gammaproteobacteria bacterium]
MAPPMTTSLAARRTLPRPANIAPDRRTRLTVSVLVGLSCALAIPTCVAHGFGQRYDLPLPLWLWVVGAGATVLLSFVVAALHLRRRDGARELWTTRPHNGLIVRIVLTLIQATGAVLFVVVIAAGWFGNSDPYRNIAPTAVWIIWWVGIAYVSALVGDVWQWANPLRTLALVAERLSAALGLPHRSLGWRYRFSYWPAVVIMLAFAGTEFIWEGGDEPANIATLVFGYSVFSWLGMWCYGREVWLREAEAFSVVFSLLARFAPLAPSEPQDRADLPDGGEHERTSTGIVLRVPGTGLLKDYPVAFAQCVLVFVLLTSVSFDGFLETPLWLEGSDRLMSIEMLQPFWDYVEGHTDSLAILSFLTLIVTVAAFVAVTWLVCAMMSRLAHWAGAPLVRTHIIFTSFVLTLIPISVAYHLAHYISLLAVSGQYIIPLLSDPFGFGWDLFGTADYKVDIGVLSVKVVWYTAAATIVIGHVIAVYVAHFMAIALFGDERAAVWSQAPMMLLMVLYTMLSLWILAQPIVS